MGSNKRYSAHYDQLMDRRILQSLARGAAPETLADAELDLGNQDRTLPPRARPCRAWGSSARGGPVRPRSGGVSSTTGSIVRGGGRPAVDVA